MLKLIATSKLFFSIFAAVFIYAVGATVFIKSLTQDNDYAIKIANEARANSIAIEKRQSQVEIDVIRSVESFKSLIVELKTEVRMLRDDVKRNPIK